MKKLISFILTFALCLALLPSAALAADYDTGIYTAEDNGTPAGDYFAMTDRTFDEVTVYGYWDLSYSPGEAFEIYYYNVDATSLTARNNNSVTVTQMDAGEQQSHFWCITLDGNSSGKQWVDMEYRIDKGSGGSFVITFQASQPAYARGLYYKPLRGVENGKPDVDSNDPYTYEPLVISPYTDRTDIAFYFYDGTDFEPVDVGFSDSLAVDPVGVADQTGWYSFAAYDFCEGTIYYYDDSTQTTYTLDVATCLPDFAFYSADTVSQANYRMYTIAEQNTNTDGEFADYKFVKTLTFRPKDPAFSFNLGPDSDVAVEISCFQKHYDAYGFETDATTYTDFDCTWDATSNANGDAIILTLFTNDSDILCWLNGKRNEDWIFGAYVNVLAPDDDSSLLFHVNDQGIFAAAKFLPKHIFRELAALGCGVTLSHEEFPGNITMDKSVVANIAGQAAPVSFCMTADAATEEEEATIAEALADNETLLDVLDLKLYFGPDSVHELGGNAVIQYQADLPNGTQVKVYYLNNGQLEAMNATYEDGVIIFSTPHFSEFVIASAPEPVVPPRPSRPSRPSNSSTTAPVKPTEPEKPAAPDFADVPEDYWAKNAIDWAAEQGYVNGTSDTGFSPESNISRQQIWMILSRVNGVGAETMEEAAKWVEEQGISDGSNPGQAVTRQQLVTLLYRYAVLMGYDVSVGEDTNILSYDDASSVSEYAIPAFQWACGAGVVNGTSNRTLSPLGTASRAQFAVMLQRFFEKVVK